MVPQFLRQKISLQPPWRLLFGLNVITGFAALLFLTNATFFFYASDVGIPRFLGIGGFIILIIVFNLFLVFPNETGRKITAAVLPLGIPLMIISSFIEDFFFELQDEPNGWLILGDLFGAFASYPLISLFLFGGMFVAAVFSLVLLRYPRVFHFFEIILKSFVIGGPLLFSLAAAYFFWGVVSYT